MENVKPMRPSRSTTRRQRRRALGHASSEAAPAVDALTGLVYAAAKGDRAAFASLYDELAPTLLGICRRVVRDPSLAEEVTQEVFVEMWRLATRFDRSKGTVRSWACAIAHNRAVDRVRSEQSSRDRDQRDADHRVQVAPPANEPVEDDLERQRVRNALDALTEVQREAVELAYYGGHTYREVAVLLDVAEGTVKTRIRDGLIRLRDELGEAS